MGRLERNRRVERERAVLERILALLLALAALADRAACLPLLKRLQLLAMLGRGEAEARTLIVAMASGAPANAADAPREAADAPILRDDAKLLATRFRMLALALHVLLALIRGGSPRRQSPQPAGSPGRRPRRAEQSTPPPSRASPDPPLPLPRRAIAYGIRTPYAIAWTNGWSAFIDARIRFDGRGEEACWPQAQITFSSRKARPAAIRS